MGWLWADPPSTRPNQNSTSTSTTTSSTQSRYSSAAPRPPSQSSQYQHHQQQTQKKPAAPSPEYHDTDPELARFMADFQAAFGNTGTSDETNNGSSTATVAQRRPNTTVTVLSTQQEQSPTSSSPTSSSTTTTTTMNSTSTSESSTTSFLSRFRTSPTSHSDPASPPSPPLDPISESLLPTSLSCQTAFDAAFYCTSIGSQFHSVYRSGTLRSCSQHWDDFWFCMRVRAWPADQRARAVQARFRDREHDNYGPGRPSSEDVWEKRSELVTPGTAFTERFEMPDWGDEEWRRWEIERKGRVLQGLREEEEEEEEEGRGS